LDLLKRNPDRFIKAKKIAEECGMETRQTQVEVRKAITELIEEFDAPIVAGANGFCYTKNPRKLQEYAQSLEQRQMGLKRRIEKIKYLVNKYDGVVF